jgi:hypothetical protein
MNQLNSMEQVVLGAILMHPEGSTQDDINLALRPKYPTTNFTPRFSGLKAKGFVVETGEKRKGRAGRLQAVMKAALPTK